MDQIKIGKFISDCRRKNKLTQEQFAENLGVNSRSVSRWENGKCMPDLSLYEPICKELNITINELLSGEKISQENYQETFEKNVIDVVDGVNNKNKTQNILTNVFLGIIVAFVIWLIGYIFYFNFAWVVPYDSVKMQINVGNEKVQGDNDLYFTSFQQNGSVKNLITKYKDGDKEIGLVFVSLFKTLADVHNESNDFVGSTIDLTNNRSDSKLFVIESNIPEHYKVYYTKVSFSKIVNASNNELKTIIKKSNLMYENK